MAGRSNSCRERILENAESIILEKGFHATSINDILDKSAITKGGFFYHFDGKPGLAVALVERYLVQDDELFGSLTEQAEALSEDPLHRLLIFLNLLAETFGDMPETHPGCLVASFTYESQQLNEHVRELMQVGLLSWRKMMVEKMERARDAYPMRGDVSIETLADMFTAVIEGGIMLALNFGENSHITNQLLAYRAFLRMVYGAE
ncbi:MAG: TetR/AcrR family transcriptional regulator [Pseudomonadota bacterium]